jgi:hypothetical protein
MVTTAVVYESMFGATRRVAEAIVRGIQDRGSGDGPVALARVTDVVPHDLLPGLRLLVLGGPTHVHSLSRPRTRDEAANWARDPEKGLALEPGALDGGLREFLGELPALELSFVAFDTRADGPEIFTGSAARAIRRRLAELGGTALLPPQSFVVAKDGRLLEGEEERAERLGRSIGQAAWSSAAEIEESPLGA